MFRLLIISMLAVLAACTQPEDAGESSVASSDAVPVAPAGELDGSVVPEHYRLTLHIDPAQPEFSGETEIDVRLASATRYIYLHGKNLNVKDASVEWRENRTSAGYEQVLDSGVALLTLEEPVGPGPATIALSYSAPFNSSSNALYSVSRGDDHYAATQFQPIAARQVFPSFDDPEYKVPFDITVIAKQEDVVITTTPETSAVTEGEYVRRTFATTRPLPTYLLAFVVGPYDVVEYDPIPPNAVRSRPLPLRGIAARGQGKQLQYALSHTAGLLDILEAYFDIPYPYAKLDLIATPAGFGGAMENVGAIIYDEWLLLLDENSSMDQRRAFMATHAHELAHMWFGDLVTPDWWTDIWLNESFATWMSYKVAGAYWPEGEFDKGTQRGALGAMHNDSLASAREVREIITHNDRITDSFDGITYQKGGGVLAMIERYAGEENFRNGIRFHMNRFADQSANAEQFMESLAQGAELSEIEPVFASFINQSGVPLVALAMDCSSSELSLAQTRYAPLGSTIVPDSATWQIPVCLSIRRGNQQTEECHLLKERRQTIPLEGTCPDYIFPNAGGTGYYRFTLDDSGWQNLIEHSAGLDGYEALSLLDSLEASFKNGTVSADVFVKGLQVLAQHEDWTVVDSTTRVLEELTNLLPNEDTPVLEDAYRSLLAARHRQAAIEGPQILMDRMQRFMLIMARAPSLRAPLAADAATFIGLDGKADRSVVSPGQIETVLSIGVQDLGEPFFSRLLDLTLNEKDPAVRSAGIGALARVEDPVLVARLQQAVLGEQFKGTEIARILFRQINRNATSQITYSWVKANLVTLLPLIPETFRSTMVPALGGNLCSVDAINEWQGLLREHESMIPGYERSMAQAIETNMLCAALRQESRQPLVTALKQAGNL